MADSGSAVPASYLGRELALIKHRLLESYLEKLFMILGMASARLGISEICYVDCFAGPWLDESEDLSSTSIGISLQILSKCMQALERRGVRITFRALYVEKDRKAFARLQRHVAVRSPINIAAEARHGDFVALRHEILEWCGPYAFAFFFIDPTGWKSVGVQVLRPLLQRQRSEFLINFMYDFVNRTASMEDWKDDIAALLGEPLEVARMSPLKREALLLNTYRKNLKANINATGKWAARSAYVRVLDRKKERAKYHLVYLTTHPKGIIEFMEISEHLDLIQKRVRASTKEHERAERTRMNDLFSPEEHVDPDAGHASVFQVQQHWIRYLSGGPKRVSEDEFASLLEDTDWFPGDFQRALASLIDEGKVRNLDAPKKRPKKPLHWEKQGERLELA